MRLAVAVPCHVYVAPPMAQSLCEMFIDLGKTQHEVALGFLGNAVSTFGRNALVRWAIEGKADAILWVDTDSVFPRTAARRLLGWGLPFIGANYSLKKDPPESTASGLDGQRLTPIEKGVEPVSVIGFGLTLTAMEVVRAVGEPWFAVTESKDGPCDEVSFCERAIKAGFRPHVDHGLSRECGHLGFKEYRLEVEC